MFEVEEKVINGNGIACIIDRIESMRVPHSKGKKDYYVMHDLVNKSNVYYIPTDNDNIRYPISMAEAQELIDSINSVEQMEFSSDRFRDEEYRRCLKESSPQKLVALLKFFVDKKSERASLGKSLPAIDDKYMKLTTRNLFSELACSLALSVKEIESMVFEKLY